MSIFSDYEAGAMSYSEFRQACGHMNRVERGGSYGKSIYPYEGDDDDFDLYADESDSDE